MHPFRLKITADCHIPLQQWIDNAATCEGLGRIEKQAPHGRKLAIVGGGSSTEKSLEELKAWDGDIWAVNSTGPWLLKHGIQSTFITVDPAPVEDFYTEGMTDALLATSCCPKLRERFQTVRLFDMVETHPDGIGGGTTTASRMPLVAILLGYYEISFFGCDSSFQLGRDHVDRNDATFDEALVIRAGGTDYLTNLQLLQQAETMAEIMNLAPNVFRNRSGGLLEAIQKHPDTWEIAAVSDQLKQSLEAWNGKSGFYETPYEVNQCPST
jgi:hypothetical protein